ncbi:MAG: preprotein translocase subunit YajC [Magnetovibrio sp.]|nr:preprotein translocase subunit YajC [Magnetovibrio sp.]
MLISPAFAQTTDVAAQSGLFQSMVPLILIFGVFYFLLIRPQQKKQKMHKEMLGSIRRGDRIVTAGGILGTVVKVIGDSELKVEIADGVKVRVDRGFVSNVIAKPEPADKADKTDQGNEGDDASDTKSNDNDDQNQEDQAAEKSGLKKLLKD